MHPTPSDRALATAIAGQLVAVGDGRVRRVVLIGSRALGLARPDSDLDLVVLVEIPRNAAPWGPPHVAAERKRLEERIAPPPVKTDLWVRTTDRYEEAKGIIGGVEMLAATEGVPVYGREFDRLPLVRRTPDQVRREHVSAWIEHAITAAEGTGNLPLVAPPLYTGGTGPRTADAGARICAERAVNAWLVYYQIAASKRDGVQMMLAKLAERDPSAARAIGTALGASTTPYERARKTVDVVIRGLAADPAMRPLLKPSQRRLAGVGAHFPQPHSAVLRRGSTNEAGSA